jgi:hypothetical protein
MSQQCSAIAIHSHVGTHTCSHTFLRSLSSKFNTANAKVNTDTPQLAAGFALQNPFPNPTYLSNDTASLIVHDGGFCTPACSANALAVKMAKLSEHRQPFISSKLLFRSRCELFRC